MGNRSQRGRKLRGQLSPPSGDGPPGVMWPDEGSGFEPSAYSPAGQMSRDSMIASNLRDDPAGTGRAIRNLILFVIAVFVLIIVVALIATAL